MPKCPVRSKLCEGTLEHLLPSQVEVMVEVPGSCGRCSQVQERCNLTPRRRCRQEVPRCRSEVERDCTELLQRCTARCEERRRSEGCAGEEDDQ